MIASTFVLPLCSSCRMVTLICALWDTYFQSYYSLPRTYRHPARIYIVPYYDTTTKKALTKKEERDRNMCLIYHKCLSPHFPIPRRKGQKHDTRKINRQGTLSIHPTPFPSLELTNMVKKRGRGAIKEREQQKVK